MIFGADKEDLSNQTVVRGPQSLRSSAPAGMESAVQRLKNMGPSVVLQPAPEGETPSQRLVRMGPSGSGPTVDPAQPQPDFFDELSARVQRTQIRNKVNDNYRQAMYLRQRGDADQVHAGDSG